MKVTVNVQVKTKTEEKNNERNDIGGLTRKQRKFEKCINIGNTCR
jgi:hypothetical protein